MVIPHPSPYSPIQKFIPLSYPVLQANPGLDEVPLLRGRNVSYCSAGGMAAFSEHAQCICHTAKQYVSYLVLTISLRIWGMPFRVNKSQRHKKNLHSNSGKDEMWVLSPLFAAIRTDVKALHLFYHLFMGTVLWRGLGSEC